MSYTSNFSIGLIGLGCVGQGFKYALETTFSNRATIVQIAVKERNKKRQVQSDTLSFEALEIINSPKNNTIVELIDHAEDARLLVIEALRLKKPVVSANKKMIATHLEELLIAQEKHGISLLYEAAVGGAIPIIRILEDYYGHERIHSIKGIVNGSSNYILTKVFEEGKSYYEALKEAQEKGFAESDPTLDVGGFDAKYKLAILILHGFGQLVKPENIFNYGIENIHQDTIDFAKNQQLKIKLIASATRKGEELFAGVLPYFVAPEDDLFAIENEFNAVEILGEFSGKQLFKGKGAGSKPTGAAVLSDVESLNRKYAYSYRKHKAEQSVQLNNHAKQQFYIYGEQLDQLPFDFTIRSARSGIVTISFESLIEHKCLLEDQSVFIAGFHQSLNKQLFASIKEEGEVPLNVL